MGKDREGKFHPGKGKPSGINKEEGLGMQHTEPGKLDQYEELTRKYTDGEDKLSDSVPVSNPNRNTNKGRTDKSGKKRVDGSKTGSGSTGDQGGASPKKGEGDPGDEEKIMVVLPEPLPGILTKDRFFELASYESECCISIYLEKPGQSGDNTRRFKNQLSELRKIMDERGMSKEDIDELLANPELLLRFGDFWRPLQSDQLAFFISKDVFKYMVMSDPVLPDRVFERSFYVTPLLPLIRRENYFYINVISKKGCKLFKADLKGIQPVPVVIPDEAADVKSIPDKNDSVFRSMDTGNLSWANLHGTDSKPDDKTVTAGFFEAIDDVFWKQVLHAETAPMILAGVEYVIPIYKSVTDYGNIWPEYLTGSREQQDLGELHRDAMELMKPYFEERKRKMLEDYANRSATELTSSVVADIVPASYYSRISVLFVKRGEHLWGKFNADENVLELAHTPDEGGEDLIDNAVTQTLINGGEVFLLDAEEMPEDSQMAALFRY